MILSAIFPRFHQFTRNFRKGKHNCWNRKWFKRNKNTINKTATTASITLNSTKPFPIGIFDFIIKYLHISIPTAAVSTTGSNNIVKGMRAATFLSLKLCVSARVLRLILWCGNSAHLFQLIRNLWPGPCFSPNGNTV